MADYLPSMIKDGKVDGKLFGLPIAGEAQILYYRKDVLEAAGIAPPKTLDELHAAAVKLNKPGEMAGILLSAARRSTPAGTPAASSGPMAAASSTTR